jgi:outer membrane protein assembly factor BamB
VVAVVIIGVIGFSCTSTERARGRGSATRHREAARVHRAWTRPVRGWPSQMTADGEGVVAVSGGRFVSALRPGDGSRRWQAEIPGWLSPYIEPAIDADSVLLSAGDRFVALDRADGRIRWEVPAGAEAPGEARGVALVRTTGAVVAVTASSDGRLVGRDAVTGAQRWIIERTGALDAHLAGDPATGLPTTGLVVAVWQAPDAATVRAVDATSGVIRWEQSVEPMVATPAVAGASLIVAAGDGDHRANVRAFGLADGRVLWTTPVPASFEPDLVPGADLGRGGHAGVVGVQDHLGTVSLLDLASGALAWRTETRVPALGGRLVITSDAVVVRNEGRQLVILDRARGRVRMRRTDPDAVPEGIVGLGDRVLVSWRWTEPGRIDALEIELSGSGP